MNPWETPTGIFCFEEWIRVAITRLNAYDGNDQFKRGKPYWINQYGLLSGRFLESAYAPDNFKDYDYNRYWYMWDYWVPAPDGSWRTPAFNGAGIPALRSFVGQCVELREPPSSPLPPPPPAPEFIGLGRQWVESENGWSGLWTRQGSSNMFDALWIMPGQAPVRATLTIQRSGNQVTIVREDTAGGGCLYQGTISGNTAQGTFGCDSIPGTFDWTATIFVG